MSSELDNSEILSSASPVRVHGLLGRPQGRGLVVSLCLYWLTDGIRTEELKLNASLCIISFSSIDYISLFAFLRSRYRLNKSPVVILKTESLHMYINLAL